MEMEQGQFSFSKHISILYRCGQSYYDDVLREYGIGCGQQFFLLRISQLPGISLLELAQIGSFDRGTATRAVQKLEELGYIRRVGDPNDRRVVRLYVTEKARPVIEATLAARQRWNDILTQGMTSKQREAAKTLLVAMSQNAHQYVSNDSRLIKREKRNKNAMGQAIEKQQNPLGYEPVQKLLAQFALPAVISMLVSAVYNIVDQIFIGQGVGFLGNAATTVSFPIVTIMLSISTLLGAGGSAYAAIKLGEKREEEAERTLGNVFMLLLAAGVLLAAVGLIFLDPILHLFGATSQNLEYSRDYASIILIGAPFNMLSVGLSNMARTDGNPRLSMYSMVIGCALNTVLDPIYIFIFGWGVKGAAIATITSQILSAVVLTVYFLSRGKMRLRRANLRPAGHICKTVIALGVSSCITQLASTILQIAMNNSLVYYGNQSPVGGDIALSAMGIVVKVSAILIAVDIGIGIGSQPILGFNRGANQPRRIKQTYRIAVTMATIVSTAGWLVCILAPQLLLRLFGSGGQLFTDFAVKCMRIFMFGVFCSGFQIVTTSYFQATGQPLKASALSMLRQLILLIPLILVLPLFMGLDGILYAGPIADITAGILVFCFAVHEMRRLDRWIEETDV